MEKIKISNNDEKYWKEFVNMYKDTFTESERMPLLSISENIKKGKNEVVVVRKEDEPVGFYILSNSASKEYSLLWYLGVSSKKQGLGLGSIILNDLIKDFKKESLIPRLLLEAETRQAKWYTKHDFLTIDYDYNYPNFTDDGQTPSKLMVVQKKYK